MFWWNGREGVDRQAVEALPTRGLLGGTSEQEVELRQWSRGRAGGGEWARGASQTPTWGAPPNLTPRRDDAVIELASVCADLDAMQVTLADSAQYVR